MFFLCGLRVPTHGCKAATGRTIGDPSAQVTPAAWAEGVASLAGCLEFTGLSFTRQKIWNKAASSYTMVHGTGSSLFSRKGQP